MQIPSKFEVKTLAEEYHGPCLSLFLPIERIGRETQQNPVRLRHLLREVEQQLEQNPQFASKQTELLEPFQKLPDDEAFWLEEGKGLALFRNLELFRSYRLPEAIREQVVVSTHFYLKHCFHF